jgi:S-adenosylmethionine decarboxylase
MIGFHLIADGLTDRKIVKKEIIEMLEGLPSEIEMKTISDPLVVEGSSMNPGWTGVIVIDKSHIAIHTFEENSKFSIDVFSCKNFDMDSVLKYLRKRIKFKKLNFKMLKRSEE